MNEKQYFFCKVTIYYLFCDILGIDFSVCLWDIYTGSLIHRFSSHGGEVRKKTIFNQKLKRFYFLGKPTGFRTLIDWLFNWLIKGLLYIPTHGVILRVGYWWLCDQLIDWLTNQLPDCLRNDQVQRLYFSPSGESKGLDNID